MASMGKPPQDASLFVSNLLSNSGPSSRLELEHRIWSGRVEKGNTEVYPIPMEVFDILHLKLEAEKEEIWDALNGPSILIVISGQVDIEVENNADEVIQSERVHTGQILFVKPGTGLKFRRVGETNVELWAAFCEA
jgi:mannose-6-phosphate isomerase class I